MYFHCSLQDSFKNLYTSKLPTYCVSIIEYTHCYLHGSFQLLKTLTFHICSKKSISTTEVGFAL